MKACDDLFVNKKSIVTPLARSAIKLEGTRGGPMYTVYFFIYNNHYITKSFDQIYNDWLIIQEIRY